MKKKICVFLFDGYSDWEISYLTPEIYKSDRFELIYFSLNGNEIRSMGGLVVRPVCKLSHLLVDEIEMLILPGGTAWEEGKNREINELVEQLFEKGKPVAAICAATTFLGQLGLLNDVKHTSNDLQYLKALAPNYSGEQHYKNELAVTGKNVITACGIAPIEFAREVFKILELHSNADIEKWYQLFKNGVWSE